MNSYRFQIAQIMISRKGEGVSIVGKHFFFKKKKKIFVMLQKYGVDFAKFMAFEGWECKIFNKVSK